MGENRNVGFFWVSFHSRRVNFALLFAFFFFLAVRKYAQLKFQSFAADTSAPS